MFGVCRQSRLSQFAGSDTDTASGEELGMIVFKLFGGRGTVGVRGMTVFEFFGGRGTVGDRGMTVFKQLGRRSFPESSSRRHTAATGFAGICTDAALPLSHAAAVLSRG